MSIADVCSLYRLRIESFQSNAEVFPPLSMTESNLPLSMTESNPLLSVTKSNLPLSMTESDPLLSMTESNPLLSKLLKSALTELNLQFYDKVFIENTPLLHGTSVQSDQTFSYAVTDNVAAFLINKILIYIRFYSELSVRIFYNSLELTKNGLWFGPNRYSVYRKVLIIWLHFQQHIMHRHNFTHLVQCKLRLSSLNLFTLPHLTLKSIWHWFCGQSKTSVEVHQYHCPSIGGGRITNSIPKSQLTDFLVQPAYLKGCDDTLYTLKCYVHQ